MKDLFMRSLPVYVCCVVVTIASSPVIAQSSLTLYGTLDSGFAYQNHSANNSGTYGSASRFALISGGQSGNRFGLKGKEKISDNTDLNFVLENGFDIGNGTMSQSGRLFGRQAWFGASYKGLGNFRLGRQYDFANEYVSELTPFGPGDFASASLGLSFGSANAERFSNMIRLETDRIEGFKAGIGYTFSSQIPSAYVIDGAYPLVPGDSRDYKFASQDNLRAISSGIQYKSGPLYATATYDSYYPNAATAKGQVPNASAWILGAAYDIGLFKVSGAYGQTRNAWLNPAQLIQTFAEPSNLGTTNNSIIFDQNIAVDSYLLGLTYSPNKVTNVFLSWQMAKPSSGMLSNSYFPIGTQTVYSFAYTYNFTPRTNIYAMGAYSTNYSLSQGLTYSLVGFGLRHKF
jgi:predicted porin